jgi:hypothetical protein
MRQQPEDWPRQSRRTRRGGGRSGIGLNAAMNQNIAFREFLALQPKQSSLK